MKYKIGRNDPCPCGSGLKYKKCCLNRMETERNPIQEFIDALPQARKEANSIKYCLHPQQEYCDGPIVKAHAIQNNRILTKLAVNGLVQTMDGVSNIFFQDTQSKGRKIATTFSGFCKYHDKTTFQDIEDCEFHGSNKQVFLFTYRTFAWHYYKKIQQIAREAYFAEKLRSNSSEQKEFIRGLLLGQRDNEQKKLFFDRCLIEKCYSDISFIIWEIPYEVQFAVSSMLELEHDILGQSLNDLTSDQATESIYLNIFPGAGKSFCIWSWPKNSDNFYMPFSKQFMELGIKDRENYLNNQMPRWTDAIIISPRLWNKWGSGIQEALVSHANFDVLYRQMEKETLSFAYQYMDTPWDFFDRFMNEEFASMPRNQQSMLT